MYLLSPIDYRLYNIELATILHYSKYRTDWRQRTLETVLRSRDYLMMAGYGFMLFFSASQATLSATAYPPFGFATVSFYGLG